MLPPQTASWQEHARRRQATDLEHGNELHRLAQLQQVLTDPDLRRMWWIARFPERFKDLKPLAEELDGLPAPQGAQDDDLRGDIRRLTDQLVTALQTPQQREVFLRVLVQTFQALGPLGLRRGAGSRPQDAADAEEDQAEHAQRHAVRARHD
ncbi:hypothetical protein [Streptomyces sp. bgisy034]|uniref:hypothetical protein n=1 Tax=Streptomyces sp. bgisy034 TaxID=3413774 RepID=UPI003EB6BE72